jgi:hypothetical protein
VLLDTNVLVRHLTGEATEQAVRATAFLGDAVHVELAALVVAETTCSCPSSTRASASTPGRSSPRGVPASAGRAVLDATAAGSHLEQPRETDHA